MNGHWGDNSNRLAEINKMMYYNSFFQDWYLKDLTSFYPPLWLYLMSLYGKLLNIEAYQTIKFGYLLVFLIYPWLLYFFWKKIVSPSYAAAIAVSTMSLPPAKAGKENAAVAASAMNVLRIIISLQI